MPCFAPLTGYFSAERTKTGKRGITFDRKLSHSGIPIRLPCNYCVGCKMAKAREWALRCLHEKRLYPDNRFVTLTYDNDHLPPGGTLVKSDLQNFMKRLRERFAREYNHGGIRFFGCGEYGEVNLRPHYHLLLFNCAFRDELYAGKNSRLQSYYTSRLLSELWPDGNHIIGNVDSESAAYTTKYILKKQGKVVDTEFVDRYGVVYRRDREFIVMSRRPGLGTEWFNKYSDESYAHDNCVIDGRPVNLPRFYDLKRTLSHPEDMERLKKKRKRLQRLRRADNTKARLRVRETLALIALKRSERKL